jgi:hypothetical protein
VQRIIFRPDGNKMMQINVGGFMCEYDFDRCTGLFSNPVLIFPEQTSTLADCFGVVPIPLMEINFMQPPSIILMWIQVTLYNMI